MTNYANIRYQPAAASTTTVANMAALIALTGMSNGDQALVQATNKLYMYSGTGWYLIATIQNDAPSAITGVNGTYELAIDGTATTITAASTDPEGFPLTWSYSTSGLGSIATVSNTDNVFTITPSTTEADAGTFTLTINATDGVNGAVSKSTSLTLNFIVIVTNSKYTTLLATATDTSDNNNITDASSNSHSITVNGDAHAGTFSPYRSGGYATSFSRSSSSELEIASMPAIGSGDCSIEVWCKIDSQAWNGIISRGAYNSSGTFSLSSRSGDTELTLIWSGTIYTTSGANINAGEWKWVQVIRSSGTVTIYVNGSSVGSWSNSANVSSTSNYIIGRVDSSDYFGGDLRDLRISTNAQSSSNGSEKLATDSNTTFLSCHLPYLSYATSSVASNTYSSISGTIETVSNSPYDYNEYSAADNGGSVYFDGNTDTIHTASTHNFANNGFSASLWYYPTLAQGALFASASNHIGTFHFSGSLSYSEIRYEYKNSSGSNTNLIGNNAAKPIYFSWNYLQIVQDSNGHIRIYSNGTQVGSTVTDAAMSGASSTAVTLGDWGSSGSSSGFQGYISDFNLTTETSPSTAVPIAPRSSTSNTKLLISGTDASIIDKSQVNNIVMNGPTTGSTTKSAFGSEPTISFISGSNTNRYLNFDPNVLNFMKILGQPSIPFTIEGIWGWQGSTASPIFEIFQDTNNFFYFGGGPGGTQSSITTDNNLYAIFKIGGVERFKMTAGIGSYHQLGSTFKHQAITRNSSGLMQHYYDGQLRSNTITHTGFDTVSWTSPVGYIGRSDWMGIYGRYEGYIHQIRLTVGLARYTANFTPPTASLEG